MNVQPSGCKKDNREIAFCAVLKKVFHASFEQYNNSGHPPGLEVPFEERPDDVYFVGWQDVLLPPDTCVGLES